MRLPVPQAPGWLAAFLKSFFWRSRRGRLVTCLGGASPDTTLLSAGEVTTELQRGVSAQSVSATLDPTQLRNWDIKRVKLILLRVFNFASRKLMAWLPPWAMGKIWNEAKPLPISPLSRTQNSWEFCFVRELKPKSKKERFAMSAHCIHCSEAWGIFCLKRDNDGIKTFKKHQIISRLFWILCKFPRGQY